MQSRSYTNLLELASGNFPVMGRERERQKMMPRSMTVPGSITELDDDQASSVASDNSSSLAMVGSVGWWVVDGEGVFAVVEVVLVAVAGGGGRSGGGLWMVTDDAMIEDGGCR
ncbi:putative alpha,alpha-trehalose-phosphate synthase (UDP-forming) [Helianthus annuus]|nr:putative alpha,alpha-trehalose-phosphate synthase (UDP-forming) [Helianthus annuus]